VEDRISPRICGRCSSSSPTAETAAKAATQLEAAPVAVTKMRDTDRELRIELVAPDGDERAAFAQLDKIVEQVGGKGRSFGR
jgi:hypothetical protein